jgi:integrase/recombinase XerD
VNCPLPPFVVQALEALPNDGRFYFWTGNVKPKTVITDWQEKLKALFQVAALLSPCPKCKRGVGKPCCDGQADVRPHAERSPSTAHAHRFRDTFATELLLQGVPLERVSVLLGHSSIRITERHYAPWIRSRQEQLEADVRRTWTRDLVAQSETKGTRRVHGRSELVN